MNNLLGVRTITLNKLYDIDENYIYDYARGEIISRRLVRPIKAKNDGYIHFHNANYDGKMTRGHRILYCKYYDIDYLSLPRHLQIDHINMKRDDNRIINLRLVTRKMNYGNQGKYKNNTSGCKGVFWHKQREKWRAQIGHHKKRIHLGYYDNIENARQAYNLKAHELNEQENACYRLN